MHDFIKEIRNLNHRIAMIRRAASRDPELAPFAIPEIEHLLVLKQVYEELEKRRKI
jgi:hypothetical protein